MAKDSWLTVNPMSGKGNATLSNSGTLHTGRLKRSTTVTASVIGLNAGKSYAVNQEPSLESIVFDKTSFNVSEDASTVTITGKSNSPKIIFSLDTGNNIPITLPTTYTANKVETSNGSAIAGDPGAKAEFSFSIAISIPKNTVGQRVGKILAVGSDVEIKAQATITQATSSYTVSYVNGDYIDTIDKTSEKVNYGGTATATATLPANTVQYAYTFDGWYDGSTKVGSDLALSVAGIISNRTFTAIGNRTLNRYTLVITVTPTGAGTTVGQGTYNYGSSVQATATPATGYNFTKWVLDTGDVSKANPLTGININGNRTVQAVFTPKTYSISANAAYRVNESGDFTTGTTGGTVSGGGTYTHGNSVSLKATPATGYSFAGWYEGNNQTSPNTSYTFTVTSNRTFVGRFQRNWYTISASSENTTKGTVSPASQRIEYGKTATVTATRKTGYILDGWYEGSTKVGSNNTLSVASITAAHTYVAKWKVYTITLTPTISPAGSGTVSAITGQEGKIVSSTATPNSGYRFNNWVISGGTIDDGTYTKNPESIRLVEGKVITVNFIKTYVVSVSAKYRNTDNTGDYTTGTAGGTVSGGGTFDTGSKVTLTATPATGYSLVGWFNSSDTSVGTSSTYTITSLTANTTLTAKFQKNWYTATYTKGTGIATISKTSERVVYNGSITAVTITLTEGYENPTWTNTGSATFDVATNKLSASASAIKSNITMVASATIKKFTITATAQYRNTDNTGSFTSGTTGGTTTGSNTYNYGTSASLVASAKAGYKFQGWYDAEGTQLSTSTTYTISKVTAAVTVYARFQKNWYTVTYTRGTGVNSLSKTSERVAYNGTVTSETAVASTGYNSPTWTKSSGTGLLSVSAGKATLSAIQSNCTLVASATINSYTISYTKNANIASISKTSETVNYGGTATCTATLPANTAQYTYSFGGWYEGSTQVGTALALSVANITAARTFEARGVATVNKYTLTVVNGSGSGTYNYGTKVTITASTIEGKTFSKWSDGVTTASREVTVTANATYTAEYTTNTYTVTYVKGTGISTISKTSETVNHGSNAAGSTATVATGYNFDGWYNGGTRVSTSLTYAPTNVKSNLTLTAKAAINKYTVTASPYFRNTDGTGNYTSGTTGGTVSGGGSVYFGESAIVTATPAAGYKFDGWYSAGATGGSLLSSSASYAISNITASKTVYARFTKKYYTITYAKSDYVASLSKTSERVAHGANATGCTMTVMSTTAQYSYAVDGWYSGATKKTSNATYAPTAVTADATYTAKGTRTLRSYTVTYNKGSYISSVSRTSESVSYGSNAAGSTATVMANTAQYSYAFDGWYNGSTRVSTALTYAPTNITGALTLEARATRTTRRYTATIGVDSSCTGRCQVGSGSTVWTSSFSETVNYGDKINLQCKLLNSGDVFAGWYENETLLSTNLTYPITVTSNRNIVAKVWFIDVSPTSLSYEASGGSKTVTVKSNIPSWSVS